MHLRTRQRFGKYVIERRIGEGGFATVYQARATIEGIRVALKIPHTHFMSGETLDMFRQEVRLAAGLDHPHILPLKYADYIEGHFVVPMTTGIFAAGWAPWCHPLSCGGLKTSVGNCRSPNCGGDNLGRT